MVLQTAAHRRNAAQGVVAIIERDGKILLQKRCEFSADPGTWVLPGGEILAGEQPRETLVRVCGNELGITVRPTREIGIFHIGAMPCPVWQVLWKGREMTLSEKTVAGVGWFTVEELLTLSPVRHEEELRSFLRSHEFFQTLAEGTTEQETTVEHIAETGTAKTLAAPKIAALVRSAQGGSHEAFGDLYDHFVTPIFRYVSFRVPPAVAEDLVADIFVKAWEKLGKYQDRKGTPFSSWLFRIARNVVIDSYRTHRDTEEIDDMHEDVDRWNDPALKITQDLQSTLLRQAMGKLPRRYREVLLLSYMSDLHSAETAAALKMREGSVRILKHRALKKLATLLPASMREELP